MQQRLELFEDARVADAAELIGRCGTDLSRLVELSDNQVREQVADLAERDATARDPGENLFQGEPSAELRNPKEEAMLRAMVEGDSQQVAYQKHISQHCTLKSASQQASRILRRPDVRARLRWLMRAKNLQISTAGEKPEETSGAVSLDEMLDRCAKTIRDARATPQERNKAMEMYIKLEERKAEDASGGALDLRRIDPTQLCEYFRKAELQGVDAVAMVKELQGGDQGPESGPVDDRPTGPQETLPAAPGDEE